MAQRLGNKEFTLVDELHAVDPGYEYVLKEFQLKANPTMRHLLTVKYIDHIIAYNAMKATEKSVQTTKLLQQLVLLQKIKPVKTP